MDAKNYIIILCLKHFPGPTKFGPVFWSRLFRRGPVEYNPPPVTLNSEMDFYLRNGRNGDFFTKWSYKIQFYSFSGTIFYVNIKVRHAYH